jgi:hypothetical protein
MEISCSADLAMEPIKILDVIAHRNKDYTQLFVVTDRKPVYRYERKGNWLIAEDSGFFSFYKYSRPSHGFQAFAGSKFDILMVGGTVEEAHGQWWGDIPEDYQSFLVSPGVATLKELGNCYVFYSGRHFEREILDAWLSRNEPSNNYEKYDKRSKNFGKHKIVSRWEV